MQAAAGQCAKHGGGAQAEAADQQVDADARRGTRRYAAADADAELLEGFRVEQVVAPAPVQQRQGAGFGVVGAKGIQAQQGVNAALFALAHRLAQGLNGGVFNAWLAADSLSTGSAVDQQFGDQLPAAVQAGLGLSLVAGDQALQLRTRLLQ